MKTKGKMIRYFPGGNTSQGFYSLWGSNLDDLNNLIILKGGPGTGKSNLMNKLMTTFVARGLAAELLMCSSDAESLDGIIFREISLGIVDGTAPHLRDPNYPGVVDKMINLGEFWDEKILLAKKAEIIELTDIYKGLFRKAFGLLKLAKQEQDVIGRQYSEGMDWKAVDKLTVDLLSELLGSYPVREGGKMRHRFASAITPQGPVNHLEELMSGAGTRYILQGKPGTGKSTLAKKLAQEACQKGFYVECYHCSLDPENMDHLYIPELGFCLLNSTPPHEIVPKPGDVVLDLLNYMSETVFQRNSQKIRAFEISYQDYFMQALEALKENKRVHDEIEHCYMNAMDFGALDKLKDKLTAEIAAYVEK